MNIIKRFFKRPSKNLKQKKVIHESFYKKHSDEFIFFKQNIIDKISISLVIIDDKGVVIAFNSLAKTNFLLHLNEKITNQIRVPKFAENLKKIQNKKNFKTNFNFENPGLLRKHFNVAFYPIDIYKMPIINYPFNKGYIISFVNNSQVIKLEKFKSEFIANLSHELKTPIAVILGIVETFLYQKRMPSKDKKFFLATLLKETNKMSDLVNDLLKLAKIEMEEHITPRNSISLDKILKQSVTKFLLQAKKRKMKINLTQNQKNIFIKGDENQLQQLFDNLIDNSIKYGNLNSKIKININLQKKENKLFVRIDDQSKGIPKQYLQRITERFYRLDESKKIEGTGLGLSIVKHIVAKHDAEFNIYSTKNIGSTFELIFPFKSSN